MHTEQGFFAAAACAEPGQKIRPVTKHQFEFHSYEAELPVDWIPVIADFPPGQASRFAALEWELVEETVTITYDQLAKWLSRNLDDYRDSCITFKGIAVVTELVWQDLKHEQTLGEEDRLARHEEELQASPLPEYRKPARQLCEDAGTGINALFEQGTKV